MANPTNNMSNDFNPKPNGLTQELKNKALNAENQVERFAHDSTQRMGEVVSNITNSAAEYSKFSRGYVRENPMTGVAIAAATGAIVGGLIVALRRRD